MTTTGPTITFRQAAEHDACQEGMDVMARYMGYPNGYREGLADVEVPIVDVLTILGLGDALTCLEWVGEDRLLQLLAADCAERVVHLTGPNPRCLLAIRVARLYAHGLASDGELRNARTAADNAGRDIIRHPARIAASVPSAAKANAYAANAAANAAVYAAYSAANAAASAVRAAAYAAASVARTSAKAAANAARVGVYANAANAASAARAAASAASAAERDWQSTRLRWYLTGAVGQ